MRILQPIKELSIGHKDNNFVLCRGCKHGNFMLSSKCLYCYLCKQKNDKIIGYEDNTILTCEGCGQETEYLDNNSMCEDCNQDIAINLYESMIEAYD